MTVDRVNHSSERGEEGKYQRSADWLRRTQREQVHCFHPFIRSSSCPYEERPGAVQAARGRHIGPVHSGHPSHQGGMCVKHVTPDRKYTGPLPPPPPPLSEIKPAISSAVVCCLSPLSALLSGDVTVTSYLRPGNARLCPRDKRTPEPEV